MSQDAAARVAAKFQAVYESADAEERAVLDEFGVLLQTISERAGSDKAAEVEGFGYPTAQRAGSSLGAVKDQFSDKTKDLEGQDKLGNFEIQPLMSDMSSGLTLSSMLGTRWPPRG